MTEEFILAEINKIKTELDVVGKEITLMCAEFGKLVDNPVRFEIYKRLVDRRKSLQNAKNLWAKKLPQVSTQGNKLMVSYVCIDRQ